PAESDPITRCFHIRLEKDLNSNCMIAVSAKEPVLFRDEIHIWSATLEFGSEDMVLLQATLAADERDRASRFRFLKNQRQFVAARGLLRHILSLYIHRAPASLQFCCSACGKPELRSESSGAMQDMCFNYSHSHSFAVFAFARNRKVGIDVEFIQPHFAEELIADRFFSRNEACALRAVPARLRAKAFLNCWTRKEAYIKARGDGFRTSLDCIEVFTDPRGADDITA